MDLIIQNMSEELITQMTEVEKLELADMLLKRQQATFSFKALALTPQQVAELNKLLLEYKHSLLRTTLEFENNTSSEGYLDRLIAVAKLEASVDMLAYVIQKF